MQKGTISVQSQNIFPIIKQFLYSDHEVFLRELVSNAVDATTKLKALANRGEVQGEIGDTTVDIIIDETAKTLTIRDKGIGMTAEEVDKYLNQVAFSSASEFLEKFNGEPIIGHFGLGFYSAFMVAGKVRVETKSYKPDSEAVVWECEGTTDFTLDALSKADRGTDVILYVNEENAEFLEKGKIEDLLRKYCSFLPVQIRFGTKTETEWDGEGEDRKSTEKTVDNIINDTNPLWKRSPQELNDEDYTAFYQQLYPYSQAPNFWIHLNIDYPFNLTGVLYLPKLGNTMELQKNKIQLYCNQVFVADDVKEIVPDFLMLLHGVIDSPDIPLNVSRSYLQSDRNVKKISSYITKKVAEKLLEIYRNQKEDYENKWKEVGTFVKYGMLTDESFYEKGLQFCLLKNTKGDFLTPENYREKIKDVQTDKNNVVVALYTHQPEAQTSQIKAAESRGYDVLVMSDPIDNHFLQHLEYKMSNIRFVRVDSDTVSNLIQKEEKTESVLSEKEQEQVTEVFKKVVDKEAEVVLQPLSPTDDAILITRPEFMRRFKEMQALQGMNYGDFPDSYQLVINSNHPLAQRLLKSRDEAQQKNTATYLYQLAKLQHGLLKGDDLAEFVKKSMTLVEKES